MNNTQLDQIGSIEDQKDTVLRAAVFGEVLQTLRVQKRLDMFIAQEGISALDAGMLMAASDQLIRCIRNGMGLNQALLWMCNAGWFNKIDGMQLNLTVN